MRRSVIFVCLLLVAFANAEKKPKFQGFTPQHLLDQKIEIEDIAHGIAPAAKPCANFGWAATAETILKYQNVFLKQTDFIFKANGGVCLTQVNDFSRAVRAISGDYALDDGRKVRIAAEYTEFTPGVAALRLEPIAAALRRRIPLMLVYAGRPLLLYGVTYDENTESSGQKNFIIRELRMMDPTAYGKPEAKVAFVNGKDDAALLQGMMTISVGPR